ncbi:MAG: 30S ribosomal protein S16 [Anaerolineales bacterium]
MLKIRLRRVGAKKQPSYRIVVADVDSPRDGRFIENIGHYNPRTEPAAIRIEEERALHWLSVGAKPTEAVERILGWTGTADRFARLKSGEDLATLVAEAVQAAEERPYPTQTRRDDLIGVSPRKSKKQLAREAGEAAAAEE